ncbi:heme-binding domain-containing protein [Yeosuana marina]|uniref:heme-binding domain-containing protein n=1 Tax=Yeosuana marina TaxID=1565536 RepID=UPI00141EA2D7|nr:heme-binding domain-containing protein [Yeosuana marina]
MKTIKKILLVLLVLFVIAQFFGPAKNQGDLASVQPFLDETDPPENVKAILKVSCYDCHSDFTRYPWYNHITPVNYWLADHIKDGKKHLNFSNWVGNSTKRKDHKMEEFIKMVENKWMPMDSYTWIHTDAKLSDAQIKEVVDWAKQVRVKYGLEPKPQ